MLPEATTMPPIDIQWLADCYIEFAREDRGYRKGEWYKDEDEEKVVEDSAISSSSHITSHI